MATDVYLSWFVYLSLCVGHDKSPAEMADLIEMSFRRGGELTWPVRPLFVGVHMDKYD